MAPSCCPSSRSAKIQDEPVRQLLVVGAAGAGKSTLLKLLKRRFDAASARNKRGPPEAPPAALPATRPTVGVEVEHVSAPASRIMLQEVGGCMTLMWERFYEPCAAILYVVDAADAATLAAAWVELLTLLEDDRSRGKRVTVVLNAKGEPERAAAAARFLGLHRLGARVAVLAGSASDGAFVDAVRAAVVETTALVTPA